MTHVLAVAEPTWLHVGPAWVPSKGEADRVASFAAPVSSRDEAAKPTQGKTSITR